MPLFLCLYLTPKIADAQFFLTALHIFSTLTRLKQNINASISFQKKITNQDSARI